MLTMKITTIHVLIAFHCLVLASAEVRNTMKLIQRLEKVKMVLCHLQYDQHLAFWKVQQTKESLNVSIYFPLKV